MDLYNRHASCCRSRRCWSSPTVAFKSPALLPNPAPILEPATTPCRLHGVGIEVILDVVYNHTAEGGDVNPYQLSFRGLDASVYYMMDPEAYEVQFLRVH